MPPPSSGLPSLNEADLDVLVSYIDDPRYWTDFPAPAVVDAGLAPPAVDAGVDGG